MTIGSGTISRTSCAAARKVAAVVAELKRVKLGKLAEWITTTVAETLRRQCSLGKAIRPGLRRVAGCATPTTLAQRPALK
jgi:hypothetical protein